MREIAGMSVLITGGGSGIGEGSARYFGSLGARVTICGRRPEALARVASQIGPACLAIEGDITLPEDRARIVDGAVRHGGGLQALVNSAGNMYRAPVEALEQNSLRALFEANVMAGMLMTGLAVPHLAARGGAVIFIGSVHTRRAFPGASPYAATKAAVEALTGVLAAELGERKICVNCVIPGAVFTEINQRAGLFDDETALRRLQDMAGLHALKRIGTVTEIAEAIVYLCRAEWTTGAVLDVDGGLGLGLTHG